MQSRVIAHGKVGGFRVIGLVLDSTVNALPVAEGAEPQAPYHAQYTTRPSYAHAPAARVHFAVTRRPSAGPVTNQIWLLVPEDQVSGLKSVEWIVAAAPLATAIPSSRHTVRLPELGAETADFVGEYKKALREYLAYLEPNAFSTFARSRLGGADWLDSSPDVNGSSTAFGDRLRESAAGLFGQSSIEQALVHRPTAEIRQVMRPSIPLTRLEAPRSPRHEWELMRTQLGVTPPELPIARAVPARFYFVHARNQTALFRALDELERFGLPTLQFLDSDAYHADVSERYQTELGLSPRLLERELVPSPIEEVALVGSDPFLLRGSDLSVIIKVKDPALLDAAFASNLKALAVGHGKLTDKTERLGAQNVRFTTSEDGVIHRFQVAHQGYVIVSNSRAALREILETIDDKRPSLAKQPDFLYMMARDAERKSDVLAYASDSFIESIVSPRSRILELRRRLAWSELRRVGYAELVQALSTGEFGKSGKQLIDGRWLESGQLQHFDGAAIRKEAGAPASSSWGTPRRLTPLIDLPTPTTVSAVEAEIYEDFVRNYEAAWSDALDPIAVRAEFSGAAIRTHLRVLPLVRDRDYQSIQELMGNARIDRGEPGLGVRFALPLDESSSLKRELEGLSQGFLGERLSLGWVGDYVFVGLADQPSLENTLGEELAPRAPDAGPPSGSFESWTKFPLYAGIHVKSRNQAGLFLSFATRFLLGEQTQIEERPAHRGVAVLRAPLKGFTRSLSIYYALGRETLLFSLEEEVLHRLIEREADGLGPRRETRPRTGQQLSVDLTLKEQSPLYRVLSWAVQGEAPQRSTRDFAELMSWSLGASPEALGQALLPILGERPVTREGADYQSSPVGLIDPSWGNRFHPRWPETPIRGSDWALLLRAFSQLRSSLSFDLEAPGSNRENRSLAVEAELTSPQ